MSSSPWPSAPRDLRPRDAVARTNTPAQAPRSTYSGDEGSWFSPPPSVGVIATAAPTRPRIISISWGRGKLARSESAKSWKPGVGVQVGRTL